jgi:putative methyltransferase (TIGR04325 family)
MAEQSVLRRLRLLEIRSCALGLTLLGYSGFGKRVITRVRRSALLHAAMNGLLGYRRSFPSFSAAQKSAAHYIPHGHEHPDEAGYHASIADTVRESDYPALFYLAPFVSEIRRVFDLGGNVGNLFYAYRRYLQFRPDLSWLVYDLPALRAFCQKLAADRKESRVRFVNTLAEASGADLFLASGSLHYFDEPLYSILSRMAELPRHVIVNRTPCTDEEDLYTVQDNKSFLVPCKIHSRKALVQGMTRLGYSLRAEWPVYELHLWIPMHPDVSERHYSGFYFEKLA